MSGRRGSTAFGDAVPLSKDSVGAGTGVGLVEGGWDAEIGICVSGSDGGHGGDGGADSVIGVATRDGGLEGGVGVSIMTGGTLFDFTRLPLGFPSKSTSASPRLFDMLSSSLCAKLNNASRSGSCGAADGCGASCCSIVTVEASTAD